MSSQRDYDLEYKRRQRSSERDVIIPPIVDPRRRAAAQADIYLFLATYFPHKFTNPFTRDQREIISEILYRARVGGDKAIAAPRGEGKTTIAECVVLYCLLFGLLKFPLICAATGPDAARILENLKHELEFNDTLAEDFPEVCAPIRALEGAPQRAGMQTVEGERTHLKWSTENVVLPTTPGSKQSGSAGSVLATRGLDAAVRGLRVNNLRPDFVLIDDPETAGSAASDLQIRTREQTIDRDIAFLGGQNRPIGRLVLCTLQNRKCLAAKLTDPLEKPSFGGRRFAFLKHKPDRGDLWEEYLRLKQVGAETGTDPDGRTAMAYYVAHRADMDRGAEVSNEHRFYPTPLPNGSPLEISALQHAYNIVAKVGWDSFATEYQNEPPAEEGPEASGITATLVRSRLSGTPKCLVPDGTIALVAGIDVGKHYCHWTVTAWLPGATGVVCDYGVADVHNADDPRIGVEKAIVSALQTWRDEVLADPYKTAGGIVVPLNVVLIDSGYCDTAVCHFVKNAGKPFRVAKGFGDSRKSPFQTMKPGPDRLVGEHWYASPQPVNGVWLWGIDADYWKRFCHERFQSVPFTDSGLPRPGALSLYYSDDPREHVAYSKHIVAEIEREEFVPGRGLKRVWHAVSKNNHWLDATALGCAAGSMAGVKLLPSTPRPRATRPPAEQQPSGFASRSFERRTLSRR